MNGKFLGLFDPEKTLEILAYWIVPIAALFWFGCMIYLFING